MVLPIMFFLPPLLPSLLIVVTLILALLALLASRARGRAEGWFPWLLTPLALLPHLLVLLRLGFAAMLSIYIAWPASMGPLSILYNSVLGNLLSWNSILFVLVGLILAGLWLALIEGLRRRWPWVAYLAWLIGLLVPGWLLYVQFLPPD